MLNGRRTDPEAYREKNRVYMKRYREKNPDLIRRASHERTAHQKLRSDVFDILGGPKCFECGCTVLAIVEVNHIKGGGRKELREKGQDRIFRDIRNGTANSADFNVLCRVCNALHYVSEILGIKGHTVTWSNDTPQ